METLVHYRVLVPDLHRKTGGPGAFFQSLKPALDRLGVELCGGLGWQADAALVSPFCRMEMLWWLQAREMPIIQRLDGIHYSRTRRFNEHMRRVYQVADVLVFQSDFSRRICQAHFGHRPVPEHVIKNGTDLSLFYPSETAADISQLRLVASAFWRPQKRLKDCVEVFVALRREVPSATLHILGDISQVPAEVREIPGVHYVGHRSRHEVAQVLRESHIFLHLSWFDPCPNAVVEALACGLPVLYTKNGGTRELVPENCGVELVSEPDFRLNEADIYNYANIPRVDIREAVQGIRALMERFSAYRQRVIAGRRSFGIETAAQQYYQMLSGCGGVRRPRAPMAQQGG